MRPPFMPGPVRLATAGLAALALALAAGCSTDSGDDPTEPTTQAATDLTAPGSTLALGRTAKVTRGDDEILLVTVTEIVQGHTADLAPLDRPQPDSETPYYVHYELEHVTGDSPYLPVDDFLSAWAGHDQLAKLTVLAPFPQCEEKTFPADAPSGSVVSGCATYVTAKDGPPLDRVQFSYGDDYDDGDGHQISWEE